jgi:hypothetical protein
MMQIDNDDNDDKINPWTKAVYVLGLAYLPDG